MITDPLEPHHEIGEIAKAWGVSKQYLYNLFDSEPGVYRDPKQRRGKRAYTTIRVPDSVLRSVYARKTGLAK